MTTNLPQQSIPIIIKGGKIGTTKRIEIQANSVFQVTQQFQSQPTEWVESNSDFSVSYIESLMVGEMGPGLQFCQTSTMAHPLTYAFKDSDDNDIFTIREVVAAKGYSLQISVDLSNDYFQITEQSFQATDAWTVSIFNTTNTEVSAVEVTDAGNIPVCRILRANEEDIYLNLEPA